MLRCAGNRIYTGYATDVKARFEKHVSGKGANFTRAFPPEKILKIFELETKSEALRLEARIKTRPKTEKEKLILLKEGMFPDFSPRIKAVKNSE
jgi:putative endonuclease